MTLADARFALDTSRQAFPVGLDATRADWLRRYARQLIVLDTVILFVATLVAVLARFGFAAQSTHVRGVPYLFASLALIPVWIGTLTLSRCYEKRFLGNGNEEFKRVANASLRVLAWAVFWLYVTKTDASRGFLAIAMGTGLVGVVAGRYGARLWLHRQRLRGHCHAFLHA